MNVKMLVHVRQLFNCSTQKINRHNQRAWVRSVRRLGQHWVLAPMYRLGTPAVPLRLSVVPVPTDIARTPRRASRGVKGAAS